MPVAAPLMAAAAAAVALPPAAAAGAAPSAADLRRAATRRPRGAYRGDAAAGAMGAALSRHVAAAFPAATPCDEWTAAALQDLQRDLYAARSPALDAVYAARGDPRRLPAPAAGWAAANAEAGAGGAALRRVQRDAHCHEAVMWLTHHLAAGARARLRARAVPLLSASATDPRRDAGGPCANASAAPALCAHAAASHVCADCHHGSATDPPAPAPPADAPAPVPAAGGQPDLPAPLPTTVTMLARRYLTTTPPTLVDVFHKDYRFARGQQRFTHDILNKGCVTQIDNATSTLWGWAHFPNGTTRCVKGLVGLKVIPQEFVRAAGDFYPSGRKRYTTPEGDARDCWVWCRRNDTECYYEDALTGAMARWEFRRQGDPPSAASVEHYWDFAAGPRDAGPLTLPQECAADMPAIYTDLTYPNLEHFCEVVVYGHPKAAAAAAAM